MTSVQNSVVIKFCGEGVEEKKNRKNCSFVSQSIENLKLCNISKNQLFRSIRRGDGFFPLLLALKIAYSFPVSSSD